MSDYDRVLAVLKAAAQRANGAGKKGASDSSCEALAKAIVDGEFMSVAMEFDNDHSQLTRRDCLKLASAIAARRAG